MSRTFISITPMQIRWTLLLLLRQMRWEAEPSRPTSNPPRHSPSHLLRSSGLGDSHLWAADVMEAGPALQRQALPREELTGLLSPGAGEALKASLPVHISPGYCVTSPAPPRKPATSFRQSRAQRCPLAASEGADTDNLGRQEAKGFRACLQDLRQNEERRAALVRAQRRPQDVHTAQFTVGGSRIRTLNLRLLPPFSLRVQEAKHSFPCLWKNPNSLAPEQRTPDPQQLGSASHKPPIPACWPKWCQELAG